jgi:hypothetical protein
MKKEISAKEIEEILDNPISWVIKERDEYWKKKIRKILSKPRTLRFLSLELERLIE